MIDYCDSSPNVASPGDEALALPSRSGRPGYTNSSFITRPLFTS